MPTTPPDTHSDDAGGLLAGAAVDPWQQLEQLEDSRRHRRRQRIWAGTIAFAVFTAIAALVATVGFSGTGAPASSSAPRLAVTAEAVGVSVVRPGRDPERVAPAAPVVGVADRAQGASPTWSLDGIATVERATTAARVAVRGRRATASASVGRVSLLDGRVELTGATLSAVAATRKGRAGGSLQLARGAKLVVDGVEHRIRINERIAVEGVGTVIVNEQAVLASAPTGDAQTGPRHRVVGAILHLRITTSTAGLPAGSQVVVGRVDAGIREGKVKKVAHPGPKAVSPPATPAGTQAGTPAPGEQVLPRQPTSVRGGASDASSGNLQGYLFPVLGRHAYSNDWGAPRASTGVPHQGNDIFADEGTPLVAITDGVLDRVGWNSIGGYRLWLFDQYGNSFYYAHLSAFSPLASDGARVRRGDVIGFVGHTGDAQYTPPHLHFEVHPGNGAATNPYPFLGAWKRGVAVAIGLVDGGQQQPGRVAPLSLLGFTDIAANSGLQSSVLDTVPDTRARGIEQETAPRPTDRSLKGAIEGPGISPR